MSTSERFRELADRYYRAWFRFHPEAAVDAGVSGYAHLLAPFAPDDLGGLVCLNDQLLVGLDELTDAELDADARIDGELMRGAALLENQFVLDVDRRCPDPGRLLPVNAIYQLTIRPVADVSAALCARLELVPPHLKRAHEYLAGNAAAIPPLWLRSAIVSARAGAVFVRGMAAHPAMRAGTAATAELLARADAALMQFADRLEADVAPRAAGDFACGRARFDRLLARRHFLDVTADQLHAFGEALVEQTKVELLDACRALTGGTDVAAALAQIRRTRPTTHDLLAVYREQMEAARTFVHSRGLVTPPPRERLDIVETPVFLRHQIPFAAYTEPTPTDPEQRGYYYVTPPAGAEQLAEHDLAGVRHTCVHEAWPGHHLQFAIANSIAAARALPRLLNASATFYEGWALYCEQLMHEQGFLAGPEHDFILRRDRLWRALRIVIDVGLHTRGLSPERAADLMVAHLGFQRAQALADITWYTRSPTVPAGYATGWAIINAVRSELRVGSSGAALRAFHDRLLSAGSIGLPKAIERVFGRAQWDAARATLFH